MKLNANLSDPQLIKLIKASHSKAFDIVYNKYYDKMYDTAYYILKDKQLCEDIVHELFVHIWENRKRIEINSLQSYLMVSVRNRVLSSLRNKKITVDLVSIEENLNDSRTVEDSMTSNEIERILKVHVDLLPEKCQKIFLLSREGQMTNKLIAEKMNITTKTVENQMSIAIKRLRNSLSDFL